MKKILLGLFALSAVAFAASKGTETAVSMDMVVKANVIEATEALMMEGEAGGTFGDALVLNFGDVIVGNSASTSGKVKVFRGNDTPILGDKYQDFQVSLGVVEGGKTTWDTTKAIAVNLISGSNSMESSVQVNSINDGNANEYVITVGATLDGTKVQNSGNYVGGAAIKAEVTTK